MDARKNLFGTAFLLAALSLAPSAAHADIGYELLRDTNAEAKTWVHCVADLINQVLAKTSYKSLHQAGRISWSKWTSFTWYRFTAVDRKTGKSYRGGLYAKWEAPSCSFYQTDDHFGSSKYTSFVLFDPDGNVVLKLTTDVFPATFFRQGSTAELVEVPYQE
jgi:hypothetical protein